MVNPFSGIITADMKTLWVQAIEALLEEDGCCAVSCSLVFSSTKFEQCANCIYNSIGNMSANRYRAGGPQSFPAGTICPLCQGSGKKQSEAVISDVQMAIFWSEKDWKEFGFNDGRLKDADVVSLSTMSTYADITRCTEAILDTSQTITQNRVQLKGSPIFCGLGESQFVLSAWGSIS
jgi:hypothetical protein